MEIPIKSPERVRFACTLLSDKTDVRYRDTEVSLLTESNPVNDHDTRLINVERF